MHYQFLEPFKDNAGSGDCNSPYRFNGKELDPETGNYYYGARYYDPKVSVWLSVDPMAHKRSWVSPYNFVQNNPLNRVDPTGALDNPIYNKDGDFLGTDDEGLQGEAIIMDENDFEQGMSHEDALDKGTTFDNLPMVYSNEFRDKISTHQSGLKDRPDWDGLLTLQESEDWWNHGDGQPLYVDVSKINFKSSELSTKDFKNVGSQKPVNFFDVYNNRKGTLWRPASDYNVSRVYGTLTIKLMNSDGVIQVVPRSGGQIDDYDFHNPVFRWWRSQSDGNPTNYSIFGYGKGQIHAK